MGLLGKIIGGITKNVFPKHTIAGKLLGSSRTGKSQTTDGTTDTLETIVSGSVDSALPALEKNGDSVNVGGVNIPPFVSQYWLFGVVIIGGVVLWQVFKPKRRKRR